MQLHIKHSRQTQNTYTKSLRYSVVKITPRVLLTFLSSRKHESFDFAVRFSAFVFSLVHFCSFFLSFYLSFALFHHIYSSSKTTVIGRIFVANFLVCKVFVLKYLSIVAAHKK